ncbi:TrmB family transcriptional regulator [Leekyejoonella antrihumi]|uniref:TrmB family transcriptional regulator n=1 Tax=Leekyejoonella antrihumi TaxID=1660198 RepID=A0A563E6T5_9MICO|nr:TrmB family transcriptional regulator [Leekyejoonella antrihumi]
MGTHKGHRLRIPARSAPEGYGAHVPELSSAQAVLGELGLTSYEAKAYLALLQRESFTAAELARQAHIPRQRIYDVVAGLMQQGLAMQRPGVSVTYAAVSPDVALDGLMMRHRQALDSLSERAGGAVGDLRSLWSQGQVEKAPMAYIEMLRDTSVLSARFHDLQISATTSMLVMSKPPYVATDNAIGLDATRRIAAGGGEVRCCYESSLLENEKMVKETVEFVAAGEDARIVDDIPLKMVLVDHSRALFSLTDPVAGALTSTNILVEHPELTAALTLAFDTVFAKGRPLLEAAREAGYDV